MTGLQHVTYNLLDRFLVHEEGNAGAPLRAVAGARLQETVRVLHVSEDVFVLMKKCLGFWQ